MADNIPQSLDYTSRDFYSLRDDLIARVKSRLAAAGKQWNGTDPSDFGVALIEAFAHVGDVTSYYIDRVANESYLTTATQRQSLLDLSQLYGYVPSGYRQASVYLDFTNSDTENTVTIPAGTQFGVDVVSSVSTYSSVTKIIYTIDTEVLVPAAVDSLNPGKASGLAWHGYSCASLSTNAANPLDATDFAGELLGSSNGLSNQAFVLSSNHMADNTLEVYVSTGNAYTLWTKVDHLADYGPTDTVYTAVVDGNNYVTVTFGDGVSGAIPSVGSAIKTTYIIGGGEEGNIKGGNTFTIVYVPVEFGLTVEDLKTTVVVTNSSENPATGGEDPESNDSIRQNAPAALRTMNRAVTLNDFGDLALTISGVGKAKAYASSPNSILMYISAQVSDVSSDYYPGYDAANTVIDPKWYTLQDSVSTFMSDKTQIGTTVSYFPPNYTDAFITVEYSIFPGYTYSQISQSIKYAIVYGYGYNYMEFDTVIYPEQIEALLMSLPGVKTARVVELYPDGGSGRAPLVPAQGELFVFRDENTDTMPIASLVSLLPSTGTLVPAFNPAVFSYRMTDAGATSLDFIPTSFNNATIILDEVATVPSGTMSPSVSVPLGVTTKVTFRVTSEDTTTSNVYTLDVIN